MPIGNNSSGNPSGSPQDSPPDLVQMIKRLFKHLKMGAPGGRWRGIKMLLLVTIVAVIEHVEVTGNNLHQEESYE